MKKSFLLLLLALASVTTPAFADPTDPPAMTAVTSTDAVAARAEMLTARLEEIKSMDKSNMTRVERKALRKEVKAIKTELATTKNGVYLSVGAIIIIVLLLILLL
ncbi:Seryl-tRNA synthetase [Flavobacterium longum]|uniref:hypothetical protein n=1 Tax=Flavobacterium longum TaxID=1299340 RepID=UPI0039EB939E